MPQLTGLIVAATDHRIGHVLALADRLELVGPVVAVGPADFAAAIAAGAGRPVVHLATPANRPAEALGPSLVELAEQLGAEVVLAPDRPAERSLSGRVAAAIGAITLPGVHAASRGAGAVTDWQITVRRRLYSGAIEVTEELAGPAVLLIAGPAAELSQSPGPISRQPASRTDPVTIEQVETGAVGLPDLERARRVIGIGRGLKAADDLALVEQLAGALGGAVACSRPLAEGAGWLPRDRHLGVSGRTIAPELYLAVGISGQVQHMVGVHGAKTIVAINTDPAAPIFNQVDYGIVGDLYQLVPELTAAITASTAAPGGQAKPSLDRTPPD